MRKKKRGPYFVYFLYDEAEVVYIGVTIDLKSRLNSHRNKKFNSVAVDRFKTKADALFHERQSTIRYIPKYSWIPDHLQSHPELGKLKVAGKNFIQVKEKTLV